MDFGVTIFPTSDTIGIVELARACDDLGFESLFLPEHTHIPVSRESVYEPDPNRPLDSEFARAFDPLVALAAAASATSRLRLGTGLCLVAQRDPIILAKEISTLDVLSDGRVLFGVGPGWNREEMRNHGVDPARRHRLLEEHLSAMRTIWTSDEAEYHGEFVDFDPIWQWPKPVQEPYPPILVGGSGPSVLARVAEHGDGWLASAKREEESQLPERIAELQALTAQRGREPVSVSLQRARPEAEALAFYETAGVTRCIFGLPNASAPEVLDAAASFARLARMFA